MVDVAVPALAVVFPHELPVRPHLVAPRGGDLGALETLWPQQRAEVARGLGERQRVARQADEDQPADLARVGAVQAEVAPIEVALAVHAAACDQLAVAR